MRRRDVLRGAAGAAALPLASTAATATTQESYAPLGSVRLEGSKEAVVSDDGATAYVATTDGFAIVDVSDPANPSVESQASALLADHEDGPLSNIYDVKVDGDTLVVVGPANPIREGLRGMAVYDVSDPTAPERRSFFETDYAIHNSYVQDGVAYLTATGAQHSPVVMVDVSGDQPEEIARWSRVDYRAEWSEVQNSNHDVYVHGDTLYVAHWDAGTWLLDVSDPANPEYVNHFGHYTLEELRNLERAGSRFEIPGNSHYVAVNDDASLLASGAEAWDMTPENDHQGGPGGIDLWNVEDPQNPEKLAFIEPPPTPDASYQGTWTTSHNFDFHGDRLYTSWYQGGVKIHDISDPANPEELAWWRQPDQAMFWTAQYVNGDAFVASNMQGSGDYPSGVYTFPNRPGEQADPPALVPENNATTTNTTTTSGATTTSATRPTTTSTTTGGSGGDGESGGSSPGFGVLAGVTAVAGAALAAWRRRE